MNVAYGGSLHPEIRDLPGRMNHRAPRLPNGEFHPDVAVVFADRRRRAAHARRRASPSFLGAETIKVNLPHGQGFYAGRARIVVEGLAEDETIEANRVAEAPGFCALWRAMACGTRCRQQPDQSHPLRGLRRGAGVKYQKTRRYLVRHHRASTGWSMRRSASSAQTVSCHKTSSQAWIRWVKLRRMI